MQINTHNKKRTNPGKEAEELAYKYLKEKFKILNKNWHSGRYGEIDIIAKDNLTNEIVFIEVKSRKTSLEDAKELVTKKKQAQLYRLAKSYLFLNELENSACRFDVIAIKINEKGKELEHIRNAFYF